MKADSTTLAGILTPDNRYVIPLFQRDYVWGKREWEDLWDDLTEIREAKERANSHFMGAIVFVAETPLPNKPLTYQVIDGQQRLVTLSILLCALRDVAKNHGFDSLSSEITNNYLTHPFKKNEERFRLYPRWRDRDYYVAAVDQRAVSGDGIGNALEFFTKQVNALPESDDKDVLSNLFNMVCRRLNFVQVNLDIAENTFQIFRSLNSTGVDLAESDLIRNFVFMKVGEGKQEEFDREQWEPLEKHFENRDPKHKGKLDGKAFSAFLRDFLMHKGNYIGINTTFQQFENYWNGVSDPVQLVNQLTKYVQLYDVIRGPKPHPLGDGKIDEAVKHLRQLDTSTTNPLVLNLLHRAAEGEMSTGDVTHALRLVSGFILRRFVCSESSRAYGKWFVAACAQLKDSPLENLRSFLQTKGFPDNASFQDAFVTFDLYKSNYALMILKSLELSLPHKERADLSKAQIEHIMPQKLTQEWTTFVGAEDGPVHRRWLHTVGNLTITAYNGELARKSFAAKRKIYQESHFSITKELYRHELIIWGESQMSFRAKLMAERAKDIWIGPDA